MEHVTVYAQPGRYAGWPANNGIWAWEGLEMLVGFTEGRYAAQPGLHSIEAPYRSLLCRSLDGGESWCSEEPHPFVGDVSPLSTCVNPIDFTHPGFAMRVVGDSYHGSSRKQGGFLISYDRGRSWTGPYEFAGLSTWPALQGQVITSRTDYVVEGKRQCLFLMSTQGATMADRVFCIRTRDGGRTFCLAGWMVRPSDPFRAVMPATVRTADGMLVSAVRRSNRPANDVCWVDAYGSANGGRTWRCLSRIGDTGDHNGNPPALCRLMDGRLCCVYGRRDWNRLAARVSADGGISWGRETVIREFTGERPDFGYPRLLQRSDGKLVAVYYWASPELPQQHIAASIWQIPA